MTAPANRRGILAGGNWIVDHVKIVDAWPTQDALATILRESVSNGGAPYNVLKDLAKLRAPFPLEAVGLLGDDADGRRILDDCRAHGIRTEQLRSTPAAATAYTDVITVANTGRRTFFHQRGANAHLDFGDFDFRSTGAKLFHLGYLLLLDRLEAMDGSRPRVVDVLQSAREAGLRTSVDCVSEDSQRFQTVIPPVLPWVDCFFANEFEAERITGIPIRSGDSVDTRAVASAAAALLESGVRSWVVIHFPAAVHALARSGESLWQPSLSVPQDEIAGTAGAGDALAAGVLFGIHENWPMAECLKLGVAAAAASLRHPTCSAGLAAREECQALADRFGYRASGPGYRAHASALPRPPRLRP